jgi:hypothetical protein
LPQVKIVVAHELNGLGRRVRVFMPLTRGTQVRFGLGYGTTTASLKKLKVVAQSDRWLYRGGGWEHMSRLPSVVIFSMCTVWSMASGQEAPCGKVDISTCPSFYAERCSSNAAFRKQNARECLKIQVGKAPDQAICATIDMKSCVPSRECLDMRDHLDRFFCQRGRTDCPKSVPKIKDGYDSVLKEFDTALSAYQPLLDLDLTKVTGKETLCGYSLDQLENYRRLAEKDRNGLKRFDGQLSHLGSCGDTLEAFLSSGKPEKIQQQLWQQIQDDLSIGVRQFAEKKGELKSKQERLERAPDDIDGLGLAHRIACPQKPEDPNRRKP